jgi:hypothetical protein|tara:strand:+ start:196 stop:339 length:144 start_codon:yes stop_codon:yes gene_type:complete
LWQYFHKVLIRPGAGKSHLPFLRQHRLRTLDFEGDEGELCLCELAAK